MGDASSFRKQSTLPLATSRNRTGVRYDVARDIPVFSDGTEWKLFGKRITRTNVVSVRAAATADQVTTVFFTAPGPMVITAIKEVHSAAGGTAGALVKVWKDPVGGVPAAGTLITSFDANGTANTVLSGTLSTATELGGQSSLILAAGDRLTVSFTGTFAALTGVVVTVALKEEVTETGRDYTYVSEVEGGLIDRCIFVAPAACKLVGVSEVHSTAGTDSGAVTLQVKKGTTALLTAALSLKTTINTPQNGTLVTTEGVVDIAPGDRIVLDYTGTTTALAGVCITLKFAVADPTLSFVNVTHLAAGNMADEAFFIAPYAGALAFGASVHGTATNGAAKAQVVKDTGTNAPGAGTDTLTNASNAGFDVNSTADTFEDAGFSLTRTVPAFAAGNRLSLDYSAATTGGAANVVSLAVKF